MIDKSRLVSLADEARANSYAVYSNYSVGAALLTKSGKTYIGVNIENASYPAGICAERAAVASAISAGEREFAGIAISGGGHSYSPEGAMPCGICRQVLSEFCDGDLTVLISREGGYDEYKLSELLPHAFLLDKK